MEIYTSEFLEISQENYREKRKINYDIIDIGGELSLRINIAYHDLTKTLCALESLHKQKKFIKKNIKKIELLTSREMDVLKLIVNGYCSKEIARKLYVEVCTISTHRKNIIKKIEVQNPMDWFLYGQAFNLIE